MIDVPFVGFPKISRWSRGVVVTEKIDGTNAQVHITEAGRIIAGSRNRWIEPGDDGFGFAAWVKEHEDELTALGPGSHFGEWWGSGIQRRYATNEKRFSLFNTSRWSDERGVRPKCCHVVPVLYAGPLDDMNLSTILERLRTLGSVASPGFMKPEGVVVFHSASGALFKKTLDKDHEPKGAQADAA